MSFEVVYTYEWHDGPRQGVANLGGSPHFFQTEGGEGDGKSGDKFLLMPIDPETFDLVLEDLAIWRRWEEAFHQGTATFETHPALPEDWGKHEKVKRLLVGRLVVDPVYAIRKSGEFRNRNDRNWSGYGWRPLEVQWSDPL